MSSQPCVVSVLIKALNEERHIARAIESALAAVARVGGEVVLADSLSTDRTVQVAATYPITITQLSHADQRSCGVGPQLGLQQARGQFLYILDADMKLHPDFLPQALAFLRAHPEVAGVAGQVIEHNQSSLEFQARLERGGGHWQPGPVDRLDMGGLYRRDAIEHVGYFSDRNLHSYEELDLALRLRAKGWRLHRLAVPAIEHWGHDLPAYTLLRRRWRSAYINGVGEITRAAWRSPHWPLLRQDLRELKLYTAVLVWALMGLGLAAFLALQHHAAAALAVLAALLAAPWLAQCWRKRNLAKASYATVSLWLHVGGLLRGLLHRRRDPRSRIPNTVLQRAGDERRPSEPPPRHV